MTQLNQSHNCKTVLVPGVAWPSKTDLPRTYISTGNRPLGLTRNEQLVASKVLDFIREREYTTSTEIFNSKLCTSRSRATQIARYLESQQLITIHRSNIPGNKSRTHYYRAVPLKTTTH